MAFECRLLGVVRLSIIGRFVFLESAIFRRFVWDFSEIWICGLYTRNTRRQAETTKQCCPGIPIIPHHQYVDFYQAGYPQRSHVASTIRHSRRRPNGSRAKRKLPCRKRQCRERAIHPLFHKKHVHIHSPRPTRWQNVASAMGYRCRPTACYSYKSDSKFY